MKFRLVLHAGLLTAAMMVFSWLGASGASAQCAT